MTTTTTIASLAGHVANVACTSSPRKTSPSKSPAEKSQPLSLRLTWAQPKSFRWAAFPLLFVMLLPPLLVTNLPCIFALPPGQFTALATHTALNLKAKSFKFIALFLLLSCLLTSHPTDWTIQSCHNMCPRTQTTTTAWVSKPLLFILAKSKKLSARSSRMKTLIRIGSERCMQT